MIFWKIRSAIRQTLFMQAQLTKNDLTFEQISESRPPLPSYIMILPQINEILQLFRKKHNRYIAMK